MPDEKLQLHQALQWAWWNHGDPPILLDVILNEVEEEQRAQVLGLYLDTARASAEANVKFLAGLRSIVGGAANR